MYMHIYICIHVFIYFIYAHTCTYRERESVCVCVLVFFPFSAVQARRPEYSRSLTKPSPVVFEANRTPCSSAQRAYVAIRYPYFGVIPRGSRYQIIKDLGAKSHNNHGL